VAPEPAPFADAIADLMGRPEERARLAAAAQLVVSTKYSREVYLRRTAEAYAMLIHRPARGAAAQSVDQSMASDTADAAATEELASR
jgi:hypothetical protein